MEFSEIVGLMVTIIVALIGVSSIVLYKVNKGSNKQNSKSGDNVNISQDIQNGSNNIQAGKNVDIKIKDWK